MHPLVLRLMFAISRLPARFVFDETTLLGVLRGMEREGAAPFALVTPELLHAALLAAADAGLVREVELDPGEFLIVRTDLGEVGEIEDVSASVLRRLRSGDLGIDQPGSDRLDRALAVSIETIALRQAVLSATTFVWSAEDYAALLEATQWQP